MRILSTVLVSALLCAGSLHAQKPEHAGNGKHEKKEQNKNHKKKNKYFSSKEKNVIESYYSSLPPGQQKKLKRTGSLPPGWQKKVSVGERMPDEYIKIAKPIPYDLKLKLESDPNSKLFQIANKIFRVEIGTNRLLAEIQF